MLLTMFQDTTAPLPTPEDLTTITGPQLRAARAWTGWSQTTLATNSGVSATSISGIERGVSAPRLATTQKLATAFAAAGLVLFGSGTGHGPGLVAK